MNIGYFYGNRYRFGVSTPKTNAGIKKWPEDIQCVYPSKYTHKGAIYVSNVQAAQNFQTLQRLHIKAVMTCARGHDHSIPKSKLEMFQYFPFDDQQTCDLSTYFQPACNFIAKALNHTNVLVHCVAGVSRSVSIVIAYLIRDRGMSYEEAYHCVKIRRKIISPNDGFIRQLKEYAKKISIREKARQLAVKQEQNCYAQKQKYYNTIVQQRRKLGEKGFKWNNTLNEEECEGFEEGVTKLRSITPNAYTHKINMTPSLHMITHDDSADTLKGSSVMLKSPLQLDSLRRAVTPQRQTLVTKPLQLPDSPKKNDFKQMSKQLNQKIYAIHAKYEKQREELMARRGPGGITRENGKLIDRSNEIWVTREGERIKEKLERGCGDLRGYFAEALKYNTKVNEALFMKGARFGELGRPIGLNYFKAKYY